MCTTIAIAIVAETCQPFTVLPAVMNEYRVPEMNVQNGVLKTLSFLFEYIGEMAKDYIYAVVPLLEDALMDRDLVHRQTACATVKHMALGRLAWLVLCRVVPGLPFVQLLFCFPVCTPLCAYGVCMGSFVRVGAVCPCARQVWWASAVRSPCPTS